MSKLSRLKIFAGFTFALSACSMASGGPVQDYESFENGVPTYFAAPRAESLDLSPWHYIHGTNSLRWDWAGGEE